VSQPSSAVKTGGFIREPRRHCRKDCGNDQITLYRRLPRGGSRAHRVPRAARADLANLDRLRTPCAGPMAHRETKASAGSAASPTAGTPARLSVTASSRVAARESVQP
jgi:hypothetical protein